MLAMVWMFECSDWLQQLQGYQPVLGGFLKLCANDALQKIGAHVVYNYNRSSCLSSVDEVVYDVCLPALARRAGVMDAVRECEGGRGGGGGRL